LMFSLLYQDIHKVSHICQGWNCDFDLVSWKCIFAEEKRGVVFEINFKHTGFSVPCEGALIVVAEIPEQELTNYVNENVSSIDVVVEIFDQASTNQVNENIPNIELVTFVEPLSVLMAKDVDVENCVNFDSHELDLGDVCSFSNQSEQVLNYEEPHLRIISIHGDYVHHQVDVMRECGMLACSKDPDKDSEYKLLFCKSDRKEKYIDTDSDSCDEIQDNRVDTREIELELSSLLSRLNEKKNEALLLSRKNSELTVEVVRLRKHLSKLQAKYDKIRLQGQNAYYENCEMRKQCEETKLISEEYLRQLTQMKRLVESNIDSGRRIQVNCVSDQSLVKLSRLETASKHQFFGSH